MIESWRRNVELMANGYCQQLCDKVEVMRSSSTIYPSQDKLLYALELVSLDDVKVVILGQDPYHGPNQSHGLAFSVLHGTKIPPSLRNIFKEIKDDLYQVNEDTFSLCSGTNDVENMDTDLTRWAEQGVLLLNATLSVEAGKAGSHSDLGWLKLTDQIIETVSEQCNNVVFILWGGDARKKAKLIDTTKHLVLEGVHPSPLSAYRGFFGCKHFSKANTYLVEHGKKPICW